MDRKLSKSQEVERLIRLGESARACLEDEAIALKHRLDVPARVRNSLKSHPTGWLFGSLASGLAASLFLRRKPARVEKANQSLPIRIIGLILTVAGPLAKVWLSGQAKHYLSGHPRGNGAFAPQAVDPSHSPTPLQ
ncbi:MAG: hypothetical protein ABIS50_19725 [Luteolibacter sp.]|uniref:hypothetical protein n=1 Tax=Luteolibacter sp. TaxID=1962973 RepID=UPI003265D077